MWIPSPKGKQKLNFDRGNLGILGGGCVILDHLRKIISIKEIRLSMEIKYIYKKHNHFFMV